MAQDPWARATQLALRQHGVFTQSQAADLGIDSRRIRTALADGRVIALSQKVLGLPGRTSSVHSVARAATFLSPYAIASHRTATALFGFELARFDHAFPDARVAVEAHSKQFHFGPVRQSVDEDRDLRAQRAGWVVVYLGWHVTRRPEEVVEILSDVVAERLHVGGVS